MTAEIIEKGDATVTIKYHAENGQEALIISMMATHTKDASHLSASADKISIGTLYVPVLESLSKKFEKEIPF